MNQQISRLFLVVSLLMAVLIAFTSWWAVWRADDLEGKTANRRPILQQQQIPRGLILARDGSRLAINKRTGRRENRRYFRSYPQGDLFAHAIGYSFVSRGDAGLERSQNDFLTGDDDEFTSIVDELSGDRVEGDDVHTTLDPEGQRAATAALAGRRGSVVVIEPKTGEIRVMVSLPSFDPNRVPEQFSQLNRAVGSPLLNRATQARYPPGSTFKVVTSAAALDSGRFNPGSLIDGRNNKPIGGVPLQNFGNTDYGSITLTEALTNSVNTVYGEVGQRLGPQTMYRYMRRFGFNREPELDYPAQQMAPSGVYGPRSKLLDDDDPVDIGRVSIGQERLQVTPLQMAQVAAAVANGGTLMKPRLVTKVVRPDGRLRDRIQPEEQADVMSRTSARELAGMMAKVVEEGSGTAAALRGIRVAGKTGTAEVGGEQNQPWFICFAPVENPRYAVAVTVERAGPTATGGEVAAPIAKQVLEALLGG